MNTLRRVRPEWFIIFAGFVLRLAFIGNNPAWYDEAFTILMAKLPLPDMVAVTAVDVHPPLYYVMGSIMVKMLPGAPLLALRGFSLVCSVAAMLLLWTLAEQLQVTRTTRLIALAMMAALPVEIFYAQEARMYAMLQMLVMAQMVLMLRKNWRELLTVSIMVLYTHNYGVFYTGLIFLAGFVRELVTVKPVYRAGIDPKWEFTPLGHAALAFAAWLPWCLYSLLGQMQSVSNGYWIRPITAGGTVYALFQTVFTTIMPNWAYLFAVAILGMVMIAITAYGMRRRRFTLLLILWGPLIAAVIISLVWKPMLLFRGLFPSMPALILLAAEAVQEKRAWLWSSMAAAVVAVSLIWLVYDNAQGITKKPNVMLPVQGSGVMVHLNAATLIPYMVYRPDMQHYLLLTGCPGDPGGLFPEVLTGLKIQEMSINALPQSYYLAAQVGPLSTQCEEKTFYQLTNRAAKVASESLTGGLGMFGVWQYGNKQ